jgi:hypothetical protein
MVFRSVAAVEKRKGVRLARTRSDLLLADRLAIW